MKTLIHHWYEFYGSEPVTASEIVNIIPETVDSMLYKYLKELSIHGAATQLGKFLDKSQKIRFSIPTLFGETYFSISRILNGNLVRYALIEIKGQDIINFTPYQDTFVSLVGGSIKIQLDKDHTLSLDPTIEEIGYKNQAKYIFLDPTGSRKYYVRDKKLSIFCKQFNLIPDDMSMVARGVRKHHKGWTGYRADKLKVRKARLRME